MPSTAPPVRRPGTTHGPPPALPRPRGPLSPEWSHPGHPVPGESNGPVETPSDQWQLAAAGYWGAYASDVSRRPCEVLAWNHLGAALMEDFAQLAPEDRNLARRTFSGRSDLVPRCTGSPTPPSSATKSSWSSMPPSPSGGRDLPAVGPPARSMSRAGVLRVRNVSSCPFRG
ncbi:hypothetical protein ACFYO2_48235 [Streptomyces sp. NPDC006602]|uniref:MmyB family transcriptional regulator n=1 Tax=Streptomyces sp. NPDC006602 TaxID=3364751 RepID=UPI0036A94001